MSNGNGNASSYCLLSYEVRSMYVHICATSTFYFMYEIQYYMYYVPKRKLEVASTST